MNKHKVVMFVYGDITTDARVQRAAKALCSDFEVVVISEYFNKSLPEDTEYRNVFVGKGNGSRMNFFRCLIEAIQILKKEKPDILYGHDYYSSLIVRFFLSHRYCKKTVYDAHELYIPEPCQKKTPRFMMFYLFEKSIVKKVDVLICANENRGRIMVEHYRLKIAPVAIRNISQLSSITGDDKTNEILSNLDGFWAKPGKTIVYAGAVISSRHLDLLVEAVAALAPDYKLLILGKGDAFESLKMRAESYSDLASLFLDAVPYKSLGAVLCRCDIGYLHYPTDTLNNIYCASNKVYEYASVHLPILSNLNPTIREILEENGIGVATDNLQEGIHTISHKLNLFKENCGVFNKNNPWGKDAELLRNTIIAIDL